MTARPIVIYCPSFDESSGGNIALHYLVDRLRKLGYDAYAFPWMKKFNFDRATQGGILKLLRRRVYAEKRRTEFRTHPSMDVAVAPVTLLSRAIAVYPEVTSGNPLGAKHVVRWFLDRQGFFNKDAIFGPDELNFFYKSYRLEDGSPIEEENVLRIRWIRNDIYFDRGDDNRSGSCRMIRKGSYLGSANGLDKDDAQLLDGKSHAEVADAFNRCEVFLSHDPYTMYLYYAALCGCVPVVVPPPGMNIDQWRPSEEERWGIAFGEENIPWARATRQKLIDRVEHERSQEESGVRRFAERVKRHFG